MLQLQLHLQVRSPSNLTNTCHEMRIDFRAPCKIYQCPEGDLLCEYCVEEKTRSYCPKCGISLAGALSRLDPRDKEFYY